MSEEAMVPPGISLPVSGVSLSEVAASIAHLVDEYTDRGWDDAGRAKFAAIILRRLRRFPVIVAAPDLLDVAMMIQRASDNAGFSGPLGNAARAAIAKALGPSAQDTSARNDLARDEQP